MDSNETVEMPDFVSQVIEQMELESLESLVKCASERLEVLRVETREKELALLESLSQKYGVTITPPKPKKAVRPPPTQKVKKPIPARFADPASGSTWTGRGRQPKWLQEYVAQGRAPSEFMVC